jgi:catechol 2,3-dioxygenase-like lactoylglutathione lyase family enzyme
MGPASSQPPSRAFPYTSVYFRDPDGSLLELISYD